MARRARVNSRRLRLDGAQASPVGRGPHRRSRVASDVASRPTSALPPATVLAAAAPARLAEQEPSAPLQFGLRTLLGLIAASSALLAVCVHVGAIWSALLVWCGLMVLAHVAGNACGTKRVSASGFGPLIRPIRAVLPLPATRLREHRGPGALVFIGIAVGALGGALVGTAALWIAYWETFGPVPVSFGGASSAFVGGFLGYLSASFIAIGSRAWRDASHDLSARR